MNLDYAVKRFGNIAANASLAKGDFAGHPFRGNQWGEGKLKGGVHLDHITVDGEPTGNATITYKGEIIGTAIKGKYTGKYRIKYADGSYSKSSYSSALKAANHSVHHYKKTLNIGGSGAETQHEQHGEPKQVGKPASSTIPYKLADLTPGRDASIGSYENLTASHEEFKQHGSAAKNIWSKIDSWDTSTENIAEIVKFGGDENWFHKIVHSWNGSSNDGVALTAQAAAQKVLGARLQPWQEEQIAKEKITDEYIANVAPTLLAQYKYTQAVLKEQGTSKVVLYRGVSSGQLSGVKLEEGEEINLQSNALESWTFSKHTANSRPVAIKAVIPASRILSLGKTGMGSYSDSEKEFVVIGGVGEKDSAVVSKGNK